MGVTYLLDTHVLLWLLGGSGSLPPDVGTKLGSTNNRLLVSAVAAMEVATKVRLGRLPGASQLVDTWSLRVREIGAEEFDLTTAHALMAGSLAWSHRDPFDRLLVAQALVDNLTMVTTDPAIAALPGVRLLTW